LRHFLARNSEHPEHHDWLLANCFAQSEALLQGRPFDADSADPLANHRAMPGSRPSSTILLDALDPRSLGALIALYEHKVFCQGMIWQLNPFDQWGVELGKTLGESVHRALVGADPGTVSPVTRRLIETVKRQQLD
jgi:glucose-6-phosphate isomerase